ncbi:MAG: DNA phosphorothioation-associated putative methyltransferase, partial [Cyanobacteria bacterium P01_A01_bin.17]
MSGISTTELNIVQLCQRSPVGKLLPDALYVHVSALLTLDPALQQLEQLAKKVSPQVENATLVKFSFNKPQIVYLFYPDFDAEAHPALQSSIQVNLKTLEASQRDYSTTDNPPVLHRKETFVASDYTHYGTFAWLTKQEAVLGLLEDSRGIGFRNAWEQRLRDRTLVIHDHSLACPIQTGA